MPPKLGWEFWGVAFYKDFALDGALENVMDMVSSKFCARGFDSDRMPHAFIYPEK